MSSANIDYNKYYLGAKISNYFKPLELRFFKTFYRIVNHSNVAHSFFIFIKIIEMMQTIILLSILVQNILNFSFIRKACFYTILLDWNEEVIITHSSMKIISRVLISCYISMELFIIFVSFKSSRINQYTSNIIAYWLIVNENVLFHISSSVFLTLGIHNDILFNSYNIKKPEVENIIYMVIYIFILGKHYLISNFLFNDFSIYNAKLPFSGALSLNTQIYGFLKTSILVLAIFFSKMNYILTSIILLFFATLVFYQRNKNNAMFHDSINKVVVITEGIVVLYVFLIVLLMITHLMFDFKISYIEFFLINFINIFLGLSYYHNNLERLEKKMFDFCNNNLTKEMDKEELYFNSLNFNLLIYNSLNNQEINKFLSLCISNHFFNCSDYSLCVKFKRLNEEVDFFDDEKKTFQYYIDENLKSKLITLLKKKYLKNKLGTLNEFLSLYIDKDSSNTNERRESLYIQKMINVKKNIDESIYSNLKNIENENELLEELSNSDEEEYYQNFKKNKKYRNENVCFENDFNIEDTCDCLLIYQYFINKYLFKDSDLAVEGCHNLNEEISERLKLNSAIKLDSFSIKNYLKNNIKQDYIQMIELIQFQHDLKYDVKTENDIKLFREKYINYMVNHLQIKNIIFPKSFENKEQYIKREDSFFNFYYYTWISVLISILDRCHMNLSVINYIEKINISAYYKQQYIYAFYKLSFIFIENLNTYEKYYHFSSLENIKTVLNKPNEDNLKFKEVLEYNMEYELFLDDIKSISNNSLDLWKNLEKTYYDPKYVDDKIYSQCILFESIKDKYYSLIEKNPSNFKVHKLYSIYYNKICKLTNESKNIVNLINSQDYLHSYTVNEKFNLIESSITIISGKKTEKDLDYIGKIIYSNNNFEQLTGYSKDFINSSNINIIVPEMIKEAHDRIIDDFLEDKKKAYIIDKVRSIYIIDSKKYYVPVNILIKRFPTYVNKIRFVSMMNRELNKYSNKIENCIITNIDGDIINYSEGLNSILNLKKANLFTSHEFSKRSININDIFHQISNKEIKEQMLVDDVSFFLKFQPDENAIKEIRKYTDKNLDEYDHINNNDLSIANCKDQNLNVSFFNYKLALPTFVPILYSNSNSSTAIGNDKFKSNEKIEILRNDYLKKYIFDPKKISKKLSLIDIDINTSSNKINENYLNNNYRLEYKVLNKEKESKRKNINSNYKGFENINLNEENMNLKSRTENLGVTIEVKTEYLFSTNNELLDKNKDIQDNNNDQNGLKRKNEVVFENNYNSVIIANSKNAKFELTNEDFSISLTEMTNKDYGYHLMIYKLLQIKPNIERKEDKEEINILKDNEMSIVSSTINSKKELNNHFSIFISKHGLSKFTSKLYFYLMYIIIQACILIFSLLVYYCVRSFRYLSNEKIENNFKLKYNEFFHSVYDLDHIFLNLIFIKNKYPDSKFIIYI